MEGAYLEVGEVDLGAGCNHIGWVHTLEADAVDLVRTGDQEETALGELLEADDSLALFGAGQENENSARCDGFSQVRGLGGLSALFGDSNIVCGIVARSLVNWNHSLFAICAAADWLLGCCTEILWLGFWLGLSSWLVHALVVSLLLLQSTFAEGTQVVRLADHGVASEASHCCSQYSL